MKKRVVLVANSASMIDHFNRDNIRLLQEKGCDVTVAANFREGNSSTDEKIESFRRWLVEEDIDIVDLPIPRKPYQIGKAIRSTRLLADYMKEKPCVLMHCQTPFGGVCGRLAAKRFRKKQGMKVIYFAHGFHFFKGASPKNYMIYYPIERHYARITDLLLTSNDEDFRAAQKFPCKDVRFVPGVGVDTDKIHDITADRTALLNEQGIPKNAKLILVGAELIPRKNVETAIRAFARMKDRNTFLLICGKGEMQEELRQLSLLEGVSERVRFLGYRTDLTSIMHMVDCLLFTSRQEGLSVVMLSAMAAGLPVVASDIRGNRDLLDHETGRSYLLPVEDADAYADKLDALLASPEEMKRQGEANYRWIKERFDLSIVSSMMSEIYDGFLVKDQSL